MSNMTSLEGKMKQHTITTSILLVLFLVLYLITPLQTQFLGLALGLSVSFLNLWTTYRKTQVVGMVADRKRKQSFLPFILAGFGFGIRIILTIAAVYLALIYPDKLDVISVIAGLALIYVIIILDMLVQFVRKR
ncbi:MULTISPECIES: ATP synthase subunit I [Alkalihalophilus]|uniref:ATP synthase subunit I n=2 Tax=Alkalihalophilus TaxID=2893060 RepID=A0AAJ2NQ82_ALKPS|nr:MULTISPECIES: ATP synthase subunit I [Alkalihalophilus]MCM3489757.1 ATP synthase subunit I [Alkalihalophilus marmarensis]MDV2886473.1 ATP synthase subunit I [Alkalihalophilus pseudofirmus]MEC2073486.1 ATP synthase subunit I [Alkalihalophilus marmarensis]